LKKPEDRNQTRKTKCDTVSVANIRCSGGVHFRLIVVRIFRPYAEESFAQLKSRPSVALAAGVLGVIALVVCVFILLLALAFMIAGWVDGGQ